MKHLTSKFYGFIRFRKVLTDAVWHVRSKDRVGEFLSFCTIVLQGTTLVIEGVSRITRQLTICIGLTFPFAILWLSQSPASTWFCCNVHKLSMKTYMYSSK